MKPTKRTTASSTTTKTKVKKKTSMSTLDVAGRTASVRDASSRTKRASSPRKYMKSVKTADPLLKTPSPTKSKKAGKKHSTSVDTPPTVSTTTSTASSKVSHTSSVRRALDDFSVAADTSPKKKLRRTVKQSNAKRVAKQSNTKDDTKVPLKNEPRTHKKSSHSDAKVSKSNVSKSSSTKNVKPPPEQVSKKPQCHQIQWTDPISVRNGLVHHRPDIESNTILSLDHADAVELLLEEFSPKQMVSVALTLCVEQGIDPGDIDIDKQFKNRGIAQDTMKKIIFFRLPKKWVSLLHYSIIYLFEVSTHTVNTF